jgi:hypothetical protein
MVEKKYLFPTREFTDEFFKRCLASEEMTNVMSNWGLDFNGDLCFVFMDIPVEAVDMDRLPENARNYIEENVHDGSLFLYFHCKGAMLDWSPASPDKEDDAGYVFYGGYGWWKEAFAGEVEVVKEILSGRIRLKGDMAKLMKNIKMIPAMQKVVIQLSEETDFIDEIYPKA